MLQILLDRFDSRLEPIAFDVYTWWLLTSQSPLLIVEFSVLQFETNVSYLLLLFRRSTDWWTCTELTMLI